jgi:hypothetical protein
MPTRVTLADFKATAGQLPSEIPCNLNSVWHSPYLVGNWYASLSPTAVAIIFVWLLSLMAVPASAQESSIKSVAKAVLVDSTTYAPAAITYAAMRLDWQTSQPLFRAGYLEQNSRFTLSGRPNDQPISEAAGHHQIVRAALVILAQSAIHNTASQVLQRAFIARYPEQKRLLKTLGLIERIGFASGVTYALSARHIRQIRINVALGKQGR